MLFPNAVVRKPVVFVQVWIDVSLLKDVARVNDQKLPTSQMKGQVKEAQVTLVEFDS